MQHQSHQSHMTMPAGPMSPEMQACIGECQTCHTVCLRTLEHCLQKGGRHAEAMHIGLLLDCAQICATSADFMLRNSPLHTYTCGACAEVCARCAEDCGSFGDDPMMEACAEACRRCADSCRRMAQMKM
jgi:hypothetical protein